MLRAIRWSVLGLAAGFALAGTASAQMSTAVRQQDWSVAGLEGPADMFVDPWGVAHIFASTKRDAFFLQGYNAARDRLWQIDLWRKRGLGRLSASFGPDYVEQDRAARLFLYRGDMAKEWAAYAPDAKSVVEAWVAGVNAYVAEVRAGKKPLPVEFRLTGSAPEDWSPEDVLRIRSHALVSNVTSEVARAQVVCAAGLEADVLRRKLTPDHTTVTPKGLDPCDVTAGVLKDYFLGTREVTFDKLAASKKKAELDPKVQLAQAIDTGLSEGSNNWIIAPSKTETGRPILANDPHRALGAPSLRYIVDLHAPGLDLMGAGEPALPGVSLGHNADIAFGLTIFAIDQEDLYVYELKSNDPSRYRYRGRWEPMTVVKETIEVKGGAPKDVELSYTRHGPVLLADPAKHRAFAMRTVWNEPGLSGYFGSSRLWSAKTWEEFKDASAAWGAPPLNLVYADVKGNIGWSASGRTPIRKNWDGLMPVPGDGRYEWAGFQPKDVLPSIYNPASGFFSNANEMNLPEDYPAKNRPAYEWAEPWRATRIREVLAANPKVSLADAMALQTDSVSTQARRGVALLAGLTSSDPEIGKALAMLTAWDFNERVDSPEAAIYEIWANRQLGKALVARATPEAARALVGDGQVEAVFGYLEQPGIDAKLRSDVLLQSLAAALADLKKRFGPDMSTWTWGRLHQAHWIPEAAALADPQLATQMTVGPLQTPGSASTPRAQTYRGGDFGVVAGASVRLVMDVGQWDNSTMINSPGQSGDPYSAHYRDLFPMWAEGVYAPMRFSRAAIENEARDHIRLTPAAKD